MRNSLILYKKHINEAKELAGLYDCLKSTVGSPMTYDDLLRFQVVYSVSAFDKLIHDLVKIGIMDIYNNNRNATPRYLTEGIPMSLHQELVTAVMPPKEVLFENAIARKFKTVSFQDPEKVAEGLSYFWCEDHKWNKIALKMGMSEKDVKTKLKLIINRRNSIVHEADFDLTTGLKYQIETSDSIEISDFLLNLGSAITSLVI